MATHGMLKSILMGRKIGLDTVMGRLTKVVGTLFQECGIQIQGLTIIHSEEEENNEQI